MPFIPVARHLRLPTSSPILLLLGAGLVVRLAFIWLGAHAYYQALSPYINNDSYSFTASFENLLYKGTYTFNRFNPEAAFGRLPGFPFFWGAHYLVFGPALVYRAVAVSQALLDTLAIYFVFATTRVLTDSRQTALLAGGLYATYPFVVVWLTISGSEALATVLTLAVFWWLTTRVPTPQAALLAGALIALALLVREYLGILLVPAFYWVYRTYGLKRLGWRPATLVMVGFLLLYLPWPIRNYVLQHRLVFIKTATAGYNRYATDVAAAREWIYTWNTEADPYLDGIAGVRALPAWPADVFASPAEEQRAYQLIKRAQQCGSGFFAWRYGRAYPSTTNCNAKIAAEFAALRTSYRHRFPIRYWTRVPLLNLQRAFFKNQLKRTAGVSLRNTLLFAYRSVLLLLGLVGAYQLRGQSKAWSLVGYFMFMYVFICVILRHLEMRYLVQADAVLLLFAAVPLSRLRTYARRGGAVRFGTMKPN